jgi:hypothetical protein
MSLPKSTSDIVNRLASKYGVAASVLVGLIQEESGWKPSIKNPLSSARGLIQFIDSTAKQLGFSSSLDLVTQYPDADSQLLGPVQKYFDMYAPFPSKEAFILSVLYPAWRNKSLSTVLPDSVRAVNPGISTLGDYVSRVLKNIRGMSIVKEFEKDGLSIGLLVLLAVGSYFFIRR